MVGWVGGWVGGSGGGAQAAIPPPSSSHTCPAGMLRRVKSQPCATCHSIIPTPSTHGTRSEPAAQWKACPPPRLRWASGYVKCGPLFEPPAATHSRPCSSWGPMIPCNSDNVGPSQPRVLSHSVAQLQSLPWSPLPSGSQPVSVGPWAVCLPCVQDPRIRFGNRVPVSRTPWLNARGSSIGRCRGEPVGNAWKPRV